MANTHFLTCPYFVITLRKEGVIARFSFFCFQINSTPIIELQELRRTRTFVQVHGQSTVSGNSSHLPIRLRFRTFVVPTVPPGPAVELSRSREPVMS